MAQRTIWQRSGETRTLQKQYQDTWLEEEVGHLSMIIHLPIQLLGGLVEEGLDTRATEHPHQEMEWQTQEVGEELLVKVGHQGQGVQDWSL